MTEIKNFDGDISVGRHAVVGGDAKVCGGMTVGKNLKVEGWLDAKNLKAANKGVFLNEESLKKAYPVPKDGWWALVGNTLPAALWVAADGEWGNTGGTGGDILLESEVLADIKERLARAQEGVDAATTKNAEQDNRLANAEGLNTKQNERLLNYVYPKLYQLNEGAGAHPFDGMYSGSASVLSGRKTVAEEGYTYKVVFALHKFLLQEISPGGVTIGLYEEWDKIISGRDSSEDYAKRDCLYYVYTEGEGSYYYYVDADGNISEKSGTYVLRKLIDETKAKVSTNTEKLDVQERYVAALNAASSEHSQKIDAIEVRAGNIETKNAEQEKNIVSLINRLYEQEEVVVALRFGGFTDAAADSLMLFNPKDTYSYQLLFSTASNSFVLRVVDNANQVTKYIGTYSSWNALDGVQASSYYERRDTLYKYLDLSYGAYRYYYYGEDGSFFEAPGTKYLSKIIEKQGGKIDENTQKVEELQAQVSSIEKVEDIPWAGRHMNMFTETGEYHIHGERTDANDGLPILNAASGHTIEARLTVLDSSLTNGTGAKTDICVTQFLRLSNRTGGDGHVYVRTAQAATKSQLATPTSAAWGTWEKLMGVFEKNAVTNIADLNTYTTNGMYSGLFADTTLQTLGGLQFTPGDTFLMVTVNGYAASAFGTPQLTQMLYRLPAKTGSEQFTAKMYIRTAWWDARAKSWIYQNWDKIATANDLSPITATAQSAKTLANNNAGRISDVEGRVSGAEGRIAAIENIIPEEYGLSTIVELGSFKNFALLLSEAAKLERVSNIGISLMHGSYLNEGSLYNGAIIIQQTNADSCTSIQYIFLEGRRFTRFIRYSSTDVVEVQSIQNDGVRDIELKDGVLQLIDMWSNPIGIGATLPDDSNIYEGNATLSTVPIVMAKAQGGTVTATLMPATSARAGVMTAADKEKLDALSIGDGGGTVDNALLTEVQEKAQSALNTAITAKTTAQDAKATADNANTAAQEAKATADGIAAKANSASIAAADAKTAATSAQTTATAAQTTANSAQTASQEAKATATTAQATANSAKSAAETAKTAATSAQETANSARETATAASTAAQEAQTKNAEQDNRLAKAEEQNTKQNERLLNYVYPKLYQINEGAGALPFDGMYDGNASESTDRITKANEGCTYKVVFKLGSFYLQEISPGGTTVCLYSGWDKIISGRGSSEDYTRRDCLYYIYVEGEGSTYYYIDSNGVKSEQSATYLLRRLVDKNTAAIAKLKTTAENAQNKLSNYADTFSQNPVASSESNGLMSAEDKKKFETVDWQELLAYGISFNTKDAEPDCTRIGNPSLHRTLPIQSKMRGGTLLPGGEFTPFENADDWTSEVRDGSAGDVMVEIPEHYIKFVSKGTIEKGQSREIWLSEYPLPGFKLVPKVYVSAYECAMYHPEGVSTSNYKIRSVVNLTADYRGGDGDPSYDEDATASRLGTACPANKYSSLDVNTVEGFSFYDYAVHKSIYWLMCVEYGTRNIHKDFIEYRDVNGYMQGGLGTTAINANVVKVGVSDTYGNRSGVVSTMSVNGATIKVPRYRGIEFPFGNYSKELKGLAFAIAGRDSTDVGLTNVYVTKDGHAAVGVDEEGGKHNEFGNQEEWKLIYTIKSSAQAQAYISDILFGDSGDIIPISIKGGGSGKYYCEQTIFYNPSVVGNLTPSCVYNNGLLDIRMNVGGTLSSINSCRRIIYYPDK